MKFKIFMLLMSIEIIGVIICLVGIYILKKRKEVRKIEKYLKEYMIK